MNRVASLLLKKNKALNSILYNNVKGFLNNSSSCRPSSSSNEGFRFFSSAIGSAASITARNAAISSFRSYPKAVHKYSMRGMCTASSVPAEKAGLKLLVTAGPRAQMMVGIWLFSSAAWVFSMVILGGITRLTRSGLSMTDWKFTGNLPPMSEEEWALEFEKYKQSPEYKRINKGMNLEDFMFIYWMEYAHRMWGRALGVMFALPFSYFLRKGFITLRLGLRLSTLFALGAGQGLIGWWMVKSGLEEPVSEYAEPRVSPYRLAAHLTSAFAIYCGLLWTALSVVMPEPPAESLAWVNGAAKLKRLAIPVSLLVGVTAVSGAFVAGNDALDHRILATATLASICGLWWAARKLDIHPAVRSLVGSTLGIAGLQVTLGISTLLSYVPVSLGTAHQAGALTLLTLMILLNHTVRKPSLSLLRTLPSVAKTT
uniref:Uncharacterized protein n=1 Tax=Chenopodium quinoa TaxID=63459 RepID=A0A803MMW0_CHEQI